jgi:hypothetical protein
VYRKALELLEQAEFVDLILNCFENLKQTTKAQSAFITQQLQAIRSEDVNRAITSKARFSPQQRDQIQRLIAQL